MIISWLAHYIFKLLCGIQAWAPSPSDNSPRAGRLGINEVAATIGGGGGQIKPLVGGGCWWTWQSGIQQTKRISSICVSGLGGLRRHRCRYSTSFYSLNKCFTRAHPFPKSSMRFKRSCVHWQLPTVELDHKSHDCFFLIFVPTGSWLMSRFL